MADLNNLDVVKLANQGTILELINPGNGETLTDEGEKLGDKKDIKPFYVRLLGSDSDVYRNTIKRRFEQSQGKNKSKKIDIEEAQQKGAELIARCTTDCYMIEDGKAVECTQLEMVRLYLKYPWLREQAEEHIGDRSALMTS